MKRLSTVFLTLCLLGMTGCNWFNDVGCSVEHAVSGAVASTLSHTLNCANPNQVLSDVTALVAKTSICSEVKPGLKGGPIALVLCPALSELATSQLGNAVPASWQCDPALAKQGLSFVLTAACNVIPF